MKTQRTPKPLEQQYDAALARAYARILVVFKRVWLALTRVHLITGA